jgi:Na+:H+ antiporter, NhaA family
VSGSLVDKRIVVMPEKVIHIIRKLHPRHVSAVLGTFLKDESTSGKLILLMTVLAILVVNTPLRDTYEHFWQLNLGVGLGSWDLTLDLRHWVSEGLMAFFFLVVGLEIKRELVRGELRNLRLAALPIAAALGGMVVPALLYASFNASPDKLPGWGIPIATDIAFAVGVLALLGRRVPLALKLFLLTLAIADDIGAIVVIALFYAEIIHYGYLATSVVLLISLWFARKQLVGRTVLLLCLGIVLWVTTHLSGIHASIIGVAMGLLAPMKSEAGGSVAARLERTFLPVSTFLALPVFAFANAGIVLSAHTITDPSTDSIMVGIILGLVVGKVVGITAATWLMVRFGHARLPQGMYWSHIVGVGFIAGIGFTVSIFITELAFGENTLFLEAAKMSIFIASAASALLGAVVLHRTHRKHASVR